MTICRLQIKICFFICGRNINNGHVKTSTNNICFRAEIIKNNVYACISQLNYINIYEHESMIDHVKRLPKALICMDAG